MTSLRCIIVDDEPLALNLLQDYIHQTPFLELVARCSSGVEALNVFKNENGYVFRAYQKRGEGYQAHRGRFGDGQALLIL
jgi:response regulator of citrate/malate metabolism